MIKYKVKQESKNFLSKQIITYLGNKRKFLNNIENMINIVCKELKKTKLVCADLFAGSGIVSRLLKKYSSRLISNDLEYYTKIINECYLSNKSEFNKEKFDKYLNLINKEMEILSNNTHTHTQF